MRPPASGRVEIVDTGCPQFGVRVSASGRKAFWCWTGRGQHRRRHVLGVFGDATDEYASPPIFTLRDARKKAREVQTEARDGGDLTPILRKKAAPASTDGARGGSLASIAELWLRLQVYPNRAAATAREYERQLERDILPAFGERTASTITKAELVRFLSERAIRAPVGTNRVQATLSSLFSWAVEEDYLAANPLMRVRKRAKERPRQRALTDAETGRIWNAASSDWHPVAGPLLRFILLTGQRPGECARARWSGIDEHERAWTREGTGEIKGGRLFILPLTAAPMRIVREMAARRDATTPGSAWVFTNYGDTPLVLGDKIKRELSERAGIDPTSWQFRDLRRTCRTTGARLGVRRDVGRMIEDHKGDALDRTYDVYAYQREMREALRVWSRHVLRCAAEARR